MLEPNKNRWLRYNKDDNPHSHASFLYIPQGTAYYNSPAISVSPTDALGNVRAGTEVTVKALVFNGGGIDAYNVYVEFWWFDPTAAFTAPFPDQRIGAKIVNVPRGNNYIEVECPNKWTPRVVKDGHECLVVQCSSPSEGLDDLKFPYMASLDRHVGQHNLWVMDNQPGQRLQLRIGNPFRSAELFTIRLSTLLVSGNMGEFRTLDVRDLMGQLGNAVVGQLTVIGGQRLQLGVTDVTEREFGVRVTRVIKTKQSKRYGQGQNGEDLARYLDAWARSDPDFNPETLGRTLVEFELHPDEARVLDFDLPPVNVGSSHFLVHHITQVVAGCDIGGYTVVVPPVDFERNRGKQADSCGP
jgi:hypothetical protein